MRRTDGRKEGDAGQAGTCSGGTEEAKWMGRVEAVVEQKEERPEGKRWVEKRMELR